MRTSLEKEGRAAATTRPKTKTTQSVSEAYRFGVIVRGGVVGKRELVTDWPDVFEDYLACNEDGEGTACTGTGEAYLSMFTYGEYFTKHYKEKGTNAQYPGEVRGHFLHMDFDCKDNPANAIAEAQEVLRRCEASHRASLDKVIACFSGNKGAHIYFPLPSCAVPSEDFGKICRAVVGKLAEGCETVDLKIYDHARIFRLPNTQHPESGKLKGPYLASEFVELDPAVILNTDETRDVGINILDDAGEWLAPFWKAAVNGLKKSQVERSTSTTFLLPPGVGLSAAAWDLISNGAPEGERNDRLFKLACELLKLRCPDSVIIDFMNKANEKSGLPDSEVKGIIKSAMQRAKDSRVPVLLLDVCKSHKAFFEIAVDVLIGTDTLEQKEWAELEAWYSQNSLPFQSIHDSSKITEEEVQELAREALEQWKREATRAATKAHKDDRGALMERLQAIDQAGTLPVLYKKIHLAPPQGPPIFNNGPLKGSFGVIIGGDGIGKGFIILDLVTGYARGEAMHIKSIGAKLGKRLRCCYVSYEEDASDLKTRMDRVCSDKVDYAALEESGWLHFVPLPKEGLFRQAGGYGGEKTPTRTLKRLERAMIEDKLDLVIIDPVASAGGLDDENSNAEVGAFVTNLRSMAKRTGCTILLVHHTSKEGSHKLDAAAGRGASALKGGARWILNLAQDKDGEETSPFIQGRITKNTHGAGCSFFLERRADGVVAEVTATEREERRNNLADIQFACFGKYVPQLVEFVKDNPHYEITWGGINNGQGPYMNDLLEHLSLKDKRDALKVYRLAIQTDALKETPRNGRQGKCLAIP